MTLSAMPKRALAAITSAVEAMRVRASIVFFSVSSISTAGTAYTAIMASSRTIETRMKVVRWPSTSSAVASPLSGGSERCTIAGRRRVAAHGLDAAVEDGDDVVDVEARRRGQHDGQRR